MCEMDYRELPNEELERLAHAGNERARAELDHRESLVFQGANSDLPVFLDGGLWVRFYKEHGFLRMVVEFPPDQSVSLDTLRAAWPTLSEWQRRLRSQRRPWVLGGAQRLYHTLEMMHDDGASYAQLAEYVNKLVVAAIQEYLLFLNSPDYEDRARDAACLTPELRQALQKYTQWVHRGDNPDGNPFAAQRARDILLAMNLSEEDVEIWCTSIEENLSNGEPPYIQDSGPVTSERVRSRLRAWRDRLGVAETG